MDLLDRVLEDRKVTADEADILCQVAREWNISREVAETAHREYLNNMVQLALADGVMPVFRLIHPPIFRIIHPPVPRPA